MKHLWKKQSRPLENSEASTIITTSELVGRVPVDELPDLQHVVVVGDEVDEDQLTGNCTKMQVMNRYRVAR